MPSAAPEAILEDTRARRAAGVADRDDVLRGEVLLSEARKALVRAEEADAVAVARLNNVLGRNAALPLRIAALRDGTGSVPDADAMSGGGDRGAARDRGSGGSGWRLAQAGRQTAAADFCPQVLLSRQSGSRRGRGRSHRLAGGHRDPPRHPPLPRRPTAG